jgi:transmembrane sensor
MSATDSVARPVEEGRIARHWDGVRHRLRRRRSRRASLVAAGALLGGVMLGALVMHRWVAGPAAVTWSELHIETGAQSTAMRLSDGSVVRLGPDTRVQACDGGESGTCIRVDRGRAHFEVTPRDSSALRVLAGAVEVRVVGTRFVVERTVAGGHHEVSVVVEEGAVRVRGPGAPELQLEAGQAWSTRLSVGGPPAAAQGRRVPDGQGAPSSSASGAEAERAEVDGARAVAEDGAPTDGPGALPPATDATEGPRALWERALQARERGAHRSEEHAYVTLLRRHPGDARARQAAFELGRLRMDAFGDPAGAIGPLRRAVRVGSDSVFHEDALARLVRAYAESGDAEACQLARQRYLERYPSGMHARFVRTLCTGP